VPNINVPETLSFLQEMRYWLEVNRQAYSGPGGIQAAALRSSDEEIQKRLLLVRQIAEDIAPELTAQVASHSLGGYSWEWHNVGTVVSQLTGVLEQDERRQAIFTPVGPSIAASQLHPWVWEASARLWDDGHRRMALQAAATAIEVQLKAKLGVDRSGADLVTKAFTTTDPRPDEPRLRFAAFLEGTESWINAHEGAMFFAKGCIQRIRNLATHEAEEPVEQLALEELAALSVLARWIEEATVVSC
jgi:Protein of unknown function (Hypoth_ymh)